MKFFSTIFWFCSVFFLIFSAQAADTTTGVLNPLDKKLITTNKKYMINSYFSGSIVLLTPRTRGANVQFFDSGKKAFSLWDTTNLTALNGFYFGKGLSGTSYQPAGPVIIYRGKIQKPLVINSTTDPTTDPNLGVHIYYNTLSNIISFNTPISLSYGADFFAGPMILTENIINPDLTQRISHRSTKHYRTFLIQKNKKTIFGITTKKMSLTDLGNQLMTIMSGSIISVVNLDGGSSTALISNEFGYNTGKVLPAWFTWKG